MRSAVFASGFRASFLAAAASATILVPLWVLIWGFGWSLETNWPPTLWHAHEMLFGFIAAAIAGFLLTAVPSWTGRRGFAGWPVEALSAAWVVARVLIANSTHWSALLVATVDVGFLGAVGALIAPPLLRAGNRNTPLLLVLGSLAACNATFHWAVAHHDAEMARHAILVGIDISLLLVTVVGGRIVPAFTANALRSANSQAELITLPFMTPAAILSVVAVVITDLVWADSRVAGLAAGIAAVINGARMLQWRSLATWRQPIVWILHLGYVWLPVGLALKCLAALSGPAVSAFWLHSLTIGVLSTMIMAVMTRASLGHTGRALVVDPAIAFAYLLLLAAALTRVFGLSVLGLPYPFIIVISACCWTAAFAIFLTLYAPILWSPRVDGKPG
jgi:uncharacterized protein involved in response to NO